MLSIAEKQAANGSRVTAPVFFPAVVSTHGEFCEGMVSLQEWLTSKYRARLQREGHRDDGAPIELRDGSDTASEQVFYWPWPKGKRECSSQRASRRVNVPFPVPLSPL